MKMSQRILFYFFLIKTMFEKQFEFNLSLTFQGSVQTIIPYPNYVFFSIFIFSVMAIISISQKVAY